ncbi:hypothetical protein AOLI_G00142780 [Acnodon oligacanthus]
MKAEPGDWLSLKTRQSHHSPAGCQSDTAIEADPLKCTSPKSAALMGAQDQGDAFPEPRDQGLSGVSAGIKQGSASLEPGQPELYRCGEQWGPTVDFDPVHGQGCVAVSTTGDFHLVPQNESQQGQAQSKLRHYSFVEDDSLTQSAVLYYQHLLVTQGPLFYDLFIYPLTSHSQATTVEEHLQSWRSSPMDQMLMTTHLSPSQKPDKAWHEWWLGCKKGQDTAGQSG